jgi:hypothetical protein
MRSDIIYLCSIVYEWGWQYVFPSKSRSVDPEAA